MAYYPQKHSHLGTASLPKRYRHVTTDLFHAKSLLLNNRIAVVPYCLWQKLNQFVGKPICLRAFYDTYDYGQVVVLHRYPPRS